MSDHNQDDTDQFGADDFHDIDYEATGNDDGAYDVEFAVEDDFVIDDWDDSFDGDVADAESDHGAPAADKKKSSFTNKLIIGAGAVLGAGVMFTMLMGGGDNAVPAQQGQLPGQMPGQISGQMTEQYAGGATMPTTPVVPGDFANNVNIPRGPDAATAPAIPAYGQSAADEIPAEPPMQPVSGGMLNDPTALAAVQRDADDVYANTEVQYVAIDRPGAVPEMPALPGGGAAVQAPSDRVADRVTDRSAVSPLPRVDAVLKSAGTKSSTETHAEQSAGVTGGVVDALPAPVTAPVTAPTPAPAASPASSLASDGASAVISAPTSVSAPTASTDAAIIDRLDLIMIRLDQVESDLEVIRKEGAAAAQDAVADIRSSVSALEKKIAERPAAPAAKSSAATSAPVAKAAPKPAKTTNAPASSSSSTAAPAPARAAVRWVLRGAQPGRAMVAQAGDSEIRTVGVGDTLSGIGRISAIAYENGRWVVTGSQGRIVQD